ncbi:MAG: MurR/RpiR family transcriptional regulator [Rhodobacter sp.]|nr:MurR/RpiR family transcriptional regulator [Rhodobacter sp.]
MTASYRIEDFEGLVAHLASSELKLSKRLRQVAQFVLNNPEDVAIYNIVELARMAGVPTSTITRFTREVGFAGFADLQAVFRQRLVGPRLRYSGQSPEHAAGALDLDNPDAVFDTFIQSGMDTLARLREEIDRPAMAAFIDTLAVSAHGAYRRRARRLSCRGLLLLQPQPGRQARQSGRQSGRDAGRAVAVRRARRCGAGNHLRQLHA